MSYATALATVKRLVGIFNRYEINANFGSTSFLTLATAVEDNITGSYREEILGALRSGVRSRHSSVLSTATLVSVLTPAFRDLVEELDLPDLGFYRNLEQWRDYLDDQSDDVNARGLTYNSITAASGTGDGVIIRLTKGPDNELLEGCRHQALEFVCVADQLEGGAREHGEIFEVDGGAKLKDLIELGGSGRLGRLQAIDELVTQAMLANPKFTTLSGTQPTAGAPVAPAAVTSINNWLLSTVSNVQLDADTYVRPKPGQTNAKSVRFNAGATVTISQVLQTSKKPTIKDRTAYILFALLYKTANATGNWNLDLGATQKTGTIAALTNTTWNRLILDQDQGLYYKNWKQQDADVVFGVDTVAVAPVYLGEIGLAPMTLIDGLPYAVIGHTTPFIRGKRYTSSITEPGTQPTDRAILQYWISLRTEASKNLGYPFSLPSDTGGTETVADPS